MQRAMLIACRKGHARKLPPPRGEGRGGGLRSSLIGAKSDNPKSRTHTKARAK